MKRILLGMVLLLLTVTVSCSREPEEPLQLTIKADKEIYQAGEIVEMEYELKNISSDEVLINKIIAPGGNLIFEFLDEIGNKSQQPLIFFEYPYWKYPENKDVIFIIPDESIKGVIEFNDKQYPQGKSRITAYLEMYTNSPEKKPELLYKLTSNTITIKAIEKK